MARYRYEAVDARGRVRTGSLDTPAGQWPDDVLKQQGLFLLTAHEDRQVRTGTWNARSTARFSRVLASLLDSGLPLARALSSIAQTARPAERAMLSDVRDRIEKGATFADALQVHDGWFTPLFIGAVRAGERSGTIAGSLARLASHAEIEAQQRQKLVSAAMYPVLLLISGSASLCLLVFWVLPRFAALFADAGADLPASTAVVLAIGAAARGALPLIGPALLITLFAVAAFMSSETGRGGLHVALFRIPIIGKYRRDAAGARYARLMAVLLNGGTPVLEALRLAAGSFTDPIARAEVMRVHDDVREGRSLNRSMSQSPLFPRVLVDLVRFGEESARTPEYLERGAELLEADGQEALHRFTTMAEPALIVFFGAVIGGVALSLLQAIYGLNGAALR